MALIKCTNCGEEISDKSFKCVHCGTKTEYSIIHICPECGKEYDNIICKNCGYRKVTETEKDAKTSIAELGLSIRSLVSGIFMGAILGFITYMVSSEITDGPLPIIFTIVAGIFGFFYGIAIDANPDSQEILDDYAMFNASPKERAMYNQLKRNGKKK